MIDISRPFAVEIPGRGRLDLGPNDHVASGGEGHVFHKDSLAVKIWDDPDRALSGRMPEKVPLLAALNHPSVVAPQALALGPRGRPVGVVMPWAEGWALPLAFTNDWRAANGFSDADALDFAGRMRNVVRFVHDRGVVMGDANELGVLGSNGTPRYLDVDSWVLPGFPGERVMQSIHDWHAPPFSLEADWFAWAVVTFQLLIGIHPYRGSHPAFKRGDLEGRMRANVSVFDPDVRLNPAVRSLSLLPGPLRDWYRAVFADGWRGLPPEPQAAPVMPVSPPPPPMPMPMQRPAGSAMLLLQGGVLVTLPDRRVLCQSDAAAVHIRLANGRVAGAKVEDGRLLVGTCPPGPGAVLSFADSGLAAIAAWSAENRLFAVLPDGLLEILTRDLGNRVMVLPGRRWPLNAKATVFGDGIAVFDALGAKHLVAPIGAGAVALLRLRELDRLMPVALKRHGRVARISLLDAAGAYYRADLLLDETGRGCQVTLTEAEDGALAEGPWSVPAGG